tara:strand:- start:347 stop:622 length:276 start_codon:yes stop_codon:yes gene_type:complete
LYNLIICTVESIPSSEVTDKTPDGFSLQLTRQARQSIKPAKHLISLNFNFLQINAIKHLKTAEFTYDLNTALWTQLLKYAKPKTHEKWKKQ